LGHPVHYKPRAPEREPCRRPEVFGSRGQDESRSGACRDLVVLQDSIAGDDHPQCRFIARYSWLKEQLNIDESKLPAVTCSMYEEALANIKTKSAVLVFPAAHGNGPASMFGHTLIRIDSTFQSDLLSYAVNYAALANDTNGFV
jgi:hypothetical protein